MRTVRSTSTVRRSLRLLSPGDRVRLYLLTAVQSAMGILDLIGVLIFGLVGVLVASIAQGSALPSPIPSILDRLGMSDMEQGTAALLLGLMAAGFLLAKGLGVLLISRKITRFLAGRAMDVSVRLVGRFMRQSLLSVQNRPSHESAMALTRGVSAAIQDTLGAAIMLTSDLVLLVLLGVSLFLIDPWITIGAGIYFFLIATGMHRILGATVGRASRVAAEADIASYRDIQDAMATFRELTVADRVNLYRDRILHERDTSIGARAQLTWASQIPRFGMEIALVLGAAALTAALLTTKNVDAAVGSLALFLAAASRVMPALMRANAARLGIRGASGEAEFSLGLADRLDEARVPDADDYVAGEPKRDLEEHTSEDVATLVDESEARTPGTDTPATGERIDPEFQALLSLASDESLVPEVRLKDVSFRYPGQDAIALNQISVSVPAGGSLAVVGPSGAGKSTLSDVILGVLRPDLGEVTIGGVSPGEAIKRWPGKISYVPQMVVLVWGTIRDNVALGLPPADVDEDRLWHALRRAELADFVLSRGGLETVVGERGVRLSGGQRQRLGLARALYSQPELLVLDEATSALDAETEKAISDTLADVAGKVTTVTIAHRLATVRKADALLYLDDGRPIAYGSFEAVRAQVPDFDRQAALLGL